VLAERGRVSDEALCRIRQVGLTEGEITEIVANVALHLFTNYLNLVARTEIDFPEVATLEAAHI
jgi:alkylhydroperoxidase family enzyme